MEEQQQQQQQQQQHERDFLFWRARAETKPRSSPGRAKRQRLMVPFVFLERLECWRFWMKTSSLR